MDFLLETMEARMQRDDIVKELKGKYCQPKSLYLTKLFFRNERKIKTTWEPNSRKCYKRGSIKELHGN